MAKIPIVHTTVATGTDAGTGEIHKAQWNEGHVTPDSVPISPSAFDDEFASTSTFSSTLGSPTANNTSDVSGYLHLSKSGTGSFQLHGCYKTAPSTPFTVTTKIPHAVFNANYNQYGPMVLDSTPTAIYLTGPTFQSSSGIPELVYGKWNSRTSRGTISEYTGYLPNMLYHRLVCHSSSNVDVYMSPDNQLWVPVITGANPGFTIANVGLFVTGNDNSTNPDSFFEWVRFT